LKAAPKLEPAPATGSGPLARLETALSRLWWRRDAGWGARLLSPLALVYRLLFRLQRWRVQPARALPVPVLVVGNLVVGGAGKTPTVLALVDALRRRGHRPGIVSRGHGRRGDGVRAVGPTDAVADVGDEPLLLARRSGMPLWVGRDRVAAARALLAAHPAVDVIVADDGLQHHALPRQAEIVVFDERGAGNGRLLPAGPLREPLPHRLPVHRHVLYTAGVASTALPGERASRRLSLAWPLAAWHAGDASAAVPLRQLQGVPLLAVAGIAAPAKFFGMLADAGLTALTLALPDHHAYATLPWPAHGPESIVLTEKDAVKLEPARCAGRAIWVLPLDFALPETLLERLQAQLFDAPPAPIR
jgi:tetraacyldisaccharide 4'-kinase